MTPNTDYHGSPLKDKREYILWDNLGNKGWLSSHFAPPVRDWGEATVFKGSQLPKFRDTDSLTSIRWLPVRLHEEKVIKRLTKEHLCKTIVAKK